MTETLVRLTPGEMRSNAEKIADEELKERVLNGIAVLTERHGADWVELVDLTLLDMQSTTRCVLGQVYADAVIADSDPVLGGFVGPRDDGYWRGLATLNGETAKDPEAFGFSIESDGYEYEDLTGAWRIAFGETV